MYTKKKYDKEKIDAYTLPIIKAALNIPTLGFGGAAVEIVEASCRRQYEKNVEGFMQRTVQKLNVLNVKISKKRLIKNIQSPEFMQIFTKILDKIKLENRKKIREAYSVALVNLMKEEVKINFNQKMYFLELLVSINEDHLKILFIFYKDSINDFQKDYFSLHDLFTKLGCYVRRPIRRGDPVPLFDDDYQKTKMITALDPAKTAYIESLLSDLDSKKLIKIESKIKSEPDVAEDNNVVTAINSIDTTVSEDYTGTESGYYFLQFVSKFN
jgi:hypothetical protein